MLAEQFDPGLVGVGVLVTGAAIATIALIARLARPDPDRAAAGRAETPTCCQAKERRQVTDEQTPRFDA